MIRIENLVKAYNGFRALDGLNLEVRAGQIYGFLGPNGAGKSTTILSTLGLIFPQEGRIRLFDLEVFNGGRFDEKNLVRAKFRIGYMPEQAALWDFLTPVQTLEIISDAFGIPKSEREKRIRELLQRVNLWEERNRKVGKFSKGMEQRLLLAQALINDPDLLILDEPMSGLDPLGIAEFKEIIREEKKAGKTVFFSSHILAHVEEICDTVGVIVKGRLVMEGKIESIKREFLGKAGYTIIVETNLPVDFGGSGWKVSSIGDRKYRITAAEDIREELNDFIVSKGAKILSMKVKEPSLEEIFLNTVE
ncbi:ABC transporter [Thermococcus sp. P6]|uniref:ABC transporter ATP-binding protein n=1 Tax=Thermococcus sp. P6 TaxID=122420 RepID=UPI000B59DF96|nr:ABC transporter ATP-binding protein [Thermococcus sp. P6]ASJ10899.1 ABC transporter [Thermococcus sp. P6]